MEYLNMHIHGIKEFSDFEISLPIEKGVYALTGENGTGKSTIAACAAMVYKTMPKYEYLGKTSEDAFIEYKLGEYAHFKVIKDNYGRWKLRNCSSRIDKIFRSDLGLFVFFEGGLYHGSRFQNTYGSVARKTKLQNVLQDVPGSFLRTKLGKVLYDDENSFSSIKYKEDSTTGEITYYCVKRNGVFIDESHLSTGEAMTLRTLAAIDKYLKMKPADKKGLMFIDEVEIGLHPSAISRLVQELKSIAYEQNYAIYLITHSLEVIDNIPSDKIIYVEKTIQADGTFITNYKTPCAAAYVTNLIYHLRGYDVVIVVEDECARKMIKIILQKENIINNRLFTIIHVGGYLEVLQRANEWNNNNIFATSPQIIAIVDGDKGTEINDEDFRNEHPQYFTVNVSCLPIKSIEKFLLENLYGTPNRELTTYLNENIFIQFGIEDVLQNYRSSLNTPLSKNDKNGKNLYHKILGALDAEDKSEMELLLSLVGFICAQYPDKYRDFVEFLRETINQ